MIKILEFNRLSVILESILNSCFMIQLGQRMVEFGELLRNVKRFKNYLENTLY